MSQRIKNLWERLQESFTEPEIPEEGLPIGELIRRIERIAQEKNGGHLTFLRFGSGWKCCLDTLAMGSDHTRLAFMKIKNFPTLEAALTDLLKTQISFYDFDEAALQEEWYAEQAERDEKMTTEYKARMGLPPQKYVSYLRKVQAEWHQRRSK